MLISKAGGELELGPRPVTQSDLSTRPRHAARAAFKEHLNSPRSSARTAAGVLTAFKARLCEFMCEFKKKKTARGSEASPGSVCHLG